MLLDSQEVFSAAQAVTANGDTASTNILDTGVAQDEGAGNEVWLTAKCTTAATTGSSATVQAVLQTATDAAFTTPVDLVAGPAVAAASVIVGYELLKTRIPNGCLRYLRIAWRIGTGTLTAGKFDAFLTLGVEKRAYYTSGFSVG